MMKQQLLNPDVALVIDEVELYEMYVYDFKIPARIKVDGYYIAKDEDVVYRTEYSIGSKVREAKFLNISNYNKSGHIGFSAKIGKEYKRIGIHVAKASTFILNENPNELVEPDHLDGNPVNNSLDNLEWVSISENRKRAFEKGLNHICTERHLTDDDVRKIRSSYGINGCNQLELADKYNICSTYVCLIINFNRRAGVKQDFESLSPKCKEKYIEKFGVPSDYQLNIFDII